MSSSGAGPVTSTSSSAAAHDPHHVDKEEYHPMDDLAADITSDHGVLKELLTAGDGRKPNKKDIVYGERTPLCLSY